MELRLNLFLLFILFVSLFDNATSEEEENEKLSKKLPQAIIIGAKKCGTRALLKFIGAHPNVTTAGAEVHFFDRFYHMGLDWYKDQMPYSNDKQITVEKTPKYLVDRRVPERAYKMNPKLKLIVVLRNPVIRAISEFVQSQWRRKRFKGFNEKEKEEKNSDSKRFEQMLYKHIKSNRTSTIKQDWAVVRNGIYINHLKQWLDYFPIEQFLFINGEQLIRSPEIEINKLEVFLNLTTPVIRKEHFVHDKRKGFACIIKPIDSKQIKCLSEQKGRKHPVIENFILKDLRDFYRPYDEQLFNLIKQEPWWTI